MSLTTEEVQNALVYRLEGALDAFSVRELRPKMEEQLTHAAKAHVFDLSQVDFVDSSGIGAVVFMYKRLAAQKKNLVLTGLSGQPLDLIKMLRIDKVIDIKPTVEDALT